MLSLKVISERTDRQLEQVDHQQGKKAVLLTFQHGSESLLSLEALDTY
jgi:hypothetical protein